MEYRIVWSLRASKQMRALDRSVSKRIYSKVDELRENPERFVERLVNSPYHRLRIGDYRVIVEIQNDILRVLILKVGHRSTVYDR